MRRRACSPSTRYERSAVLHSTARRAEIEPPPSPPCRYSFVPSTVDAILLRIGGSARLFISAVRHMPLNRSATLLGARHTAPPGLAKLALVSHVGAHPKPPLEQHTLFGLTSSR